MGGLALLTRPSQALFEGNWMPFWERGFHGAGYEIGIFRKRLVGGCSRITGFWLGAMGSRLLPFRGGG